MVAGLYITPDIRSILTIEMAITALAAVSRKITTACLNSVVSILIRFSYLYDVVPKRFGLKPMFPLFLTYA